MMAFQPLPLKVLAIGSPLSEISTLISKITAINGKHGPFDACVIVGDLFAEGSDGSEITGLNFPVPTYFTLGKNALPENVTARIIESGGEVANNLVFLGKSNVLTTAQGLKIACVGGHYDQAVYDSGEESSPLSPTLTQSSVSAILANPLFAPVPPVDAGISLASARSSSVALPSAFSGVDLLLFSTPPPSLALLSPSYTTLGFPLADAATPLIEVVKKTRPRYMFWGEGEGFWEREPWGWVGAAGKEERWTRAVKLGSLGGETPEGGKKARWFYAFTLPAQTPSTPIPARPANATPNPYILAPTGSGSIPLLPGGTKRPALEDQNFAYGGGQGGAKRGKTEHAPPPEHYVCKICHLPGHWIQDCPQKATDTPAAPPPGYICNICQQPGHFIRECPNKESTDRARPPGTSKPPPAGYNCRACGVEAQHYIKDCPLVLERDQERAKRKELGPAECWFCLSNPKVTKHLIVGIGSETYVTLPKGQLIPTLPKHIAQGGSKPLVPGGGHVLIIPIAHHPTLLSIPAQDSIPILSEIESYKSSLRACYAKYNSSAVCFEIGRLSGKGGHAHIQVIPIPSELGDKVAEAFMKAGEKSGIDWEAEPERALARVGATGNYFRVDCPDGRKLVHLLKGNFDLQFGRMVIASLLGLQHRIDWKACSQSEAEEKDDAVKFKKALAPFLT